MLKVLISFLLLALLAAGNSVFAQSAAARKQYAQASQEASVRSGNFPAGFNITTEGTEAIYLIYHKPQITYEECFSLFYDANWISSLQKAGFTQFICTDAGNARYPFDLFLERAVIRKHFAERNRVDTIKLMGSNLPPGFNVTAEGPDATVFVYHQTQISHDQCNSMFNKEDWISTLQKPGFTQLVCTDAGNARFPVDFGQRQPSPTQTFNHRNSTTDPKPVSDYMRQVGLMYMEEIDSLDKDCYDHMFEDGYCTKRTERAQTTFKMLEDRIELQLDKGGRPAGDRPYYTILHDAKYHWTMKEATIYLMRNLPRDDPRQEQLHAALHQRILVYASCYTAGRNGSKDGEITPYEEEQCINATNALLEAIHPELKK